MTRAVYDIIGLAPRVAEPLNKLGDLPGVSVELTLVAEGDEDRLAMIEQVAAQNKVILLRRDES